jgi:hypothetical protein
MVKLPSAKVCTAVALGIILLVSMILHPPNLKILASDDYRHACNMLASVACCRSQNEGGGAGVN